jgi:hypothetical protein
MADRATLAQIQAAIAFGFLAAKFVTERDRWPVFIAWQKTQGSVPLDPSFDRDYAKILLDELALGMQIPAAMRDA